MALKPLREHEHEAHQRHRTATTYPQPNGIACPECGNELMDSDAMLLLSYPPKKNIHCTACGYRGYRTA